jgi:hypothetical protein
LTRLLLDTHLLLWWLSGDPRLPQQVVERVQAPGAEVFVSQASLWEMAIKLPIGRLQVDLPDLERQVPLRIHAVSATCMCALVEGTQHFVEQIYGRHGCGEVEHRCMPPGASESSFHSAATTNPRNHRSR